MFNNSDYGLLVSNSIAWSLLTIGSLIKPILLNVFILNGINDLIFTVLQDTAFICTITYTGLNIAKFLGYDVGIKDKLKKKKKKNNDNDNDNNEGD